MASDEYVFIPGGHHEKITGIMSVPEQYDGMEKPAIILSHGAGNDMFAPLLEHMAHLLEQAGSLCLRFNFPYRDKGRKSPDSDDVLTDTFRSVYWFLKDHLVYRPSRVIVGGKSLGGRIASQAVAGGLLDARGLIFFGYPLHSPGRKDILRDAHLYRINIPMLFFAGTKDPFCNVEVLRDVISRIQAPCSLEVIEEGDHSFKVPMNAGITEEQVYANILGKTLSWLDKLG